MGSFSFLHAADLHLDSPFRGLLQSTPQFREELIRASFRAWDRLVETAIARKVDFVLLAGDLTDHSGKSVRAQVRLSQGFRMLQEHGIAVYAIRGNHDPEDGEWSKTEWPDNVYFFPSHQVSRQVAHTRDGQPAAHVYGISYPRRTVTDNLAKLFPAPERGLYNIALLHANVDGREGHEPYSPCSKDELISKGYDYWALGHIHVPQVLYERPYIVYAGNLQGRHMKEQGARGCYYIEANDSGDTNIEFLSLSEIEFVRLEVDISDAEELLQLHDLVMYALEERVLQSGRSYIYRVRFTGKGKLYAYLQDTEQVGEWLADITESLAASAADRSGSVWLEGWENAAAPEIDLNLLAQDNPFIQQLLQYAELTGEMGSESWMKELLNPLMDHRKTAKYVQLPSLERQQQLLAQAKQLTMVLLASREDA